MKDERQKDDDLLNRIEEAEEGEEGEEEAELVQVEPALGQQDVDPQFEMAGSSGSPDDVGPPAEVWPSLEGGLGR